MSATLKSWLLVISASLSACVLPPPRPATPNLVTRLPLASTEQAEGEWPTTHWWTRYVDSTLDQLIDQALMNAPAMASAEARFNAARESVRVAAAADGLRVDGKASVTRQRLSDNGLFPPEFLGFHWYNQADLGLQASYTFDWWHQRRDQIEAAIDQARAAQAERSAASLALAAAVGDAYFGWQADQARLASVREQEGLAERRRAVQTLRLNAQLEAADGLYQLDGELAELRARAAALESSARLRRILLAALIGCSTDELPNFEARPLPAVQARLPDALSIDLISRRADITASRWRVEAAEKELTAARAEFMPDISLNALAALSSIDLGKLLEAGSAAPSFGAAIHLPIFDGGLLKAKYGARAAQVQTAVAAYNDTLVTAAKEVATEVATLDKIAAQRAQQQAQVSAAEKLTSINAARVKQGLIDVRPQLYSMQALLTARAGLIDLDAAAVSADINLNVALGGGFQGGGFQQPAELQDRAALLLDGK